MALDHYVPQVHLKNFYSPALGERMYAVRKSDGMAFTPDAPSVCRIEEGNTNAYLTKDRAVEDFLKSVEPKYNASVKKLFAGEANAEAIYVVSGFISYILTCSPTAMRLKAAQLKAILEDTARTLDAMGALPPPPESLAGASMTELLSKGAVKFKVDPKYPQAIGITNILELVLTYGNSAWELLRNPFTESPFFTSDFPAVIASSDDSRVEIRIVPLTPFLAVRVCLDKSLERDQLDFGFRQFRCRARDITHDELRALNRLSVCCAEDLVFYRDDLHWVKPFILKHAGYHLETQVRELGTRHQSVLIFQQKIVQRR
jgi:ribonucleotide reductase beta subunit family protein with ferritin-like domain